MPRYEVHCGDWVSGDLLTRYFVAADEEAAKAIFSRDYLDNWAYDRYDFLRLEEVVQEKIVRKIASGHPSAKRPTG